MRAWHESKAREDARKQGKGTRHENKAKEQGKRARHESKARQEGKA